MRLKRLDVSGFGTFHSPATVNLSDVDYFAIVGPTGSGKTTLLDAIVFALYGSAPRWGERDILALAPSQSTGRVCLVFEVGGQRYAASRKVARGTNDTVTTKEARLERLSFDGDLSGEVEDVLDQATETLAGSAREMRAAVESLLGLNYTQFTQCMVLPQGEFDHFLHASSKERNDILVKLLGMQVYEQVRMAAQQRRKSSETKSDELRQQLESASAATPEAEALAQQRLRKVQSLRVALPEAVARLSEAELNLATERQRLARVDTELEVLAETIVPEGTGELAGRETLAAEAVLAARKKLAEAEVALGKVRAEMEQAGEVSYWGNLVEAHHERAELNTKLGEQRIEAVSLEEQLHGLVEARDTRKVDLRSAEQTLRRAEAAHAAAILAAQLTIGELCPVCEHPVASLHEHPAPTDLQPAADSVASAQKALESASGTLTEHEKRVFGLGTSMEGLGEQIRKLDKALVDQPDSEETERRKATAEAAVKQHTEALGVQRNAHEVLAAAEMGRTDLQGELAVARRDLGSSRDRLVLTGLDDAPVARGDDLAQDWAALTSWAASESGRRSSQRPGLVKGAEQAAANLDAVRTEIAKRFSDVAVPIPDQMLPAVLEMQAAHEEEAAQKEVGQIHEQLGRVSEVEACSG